MILVVYWFFSFLWCILVFLLFLSSQFLEIEWLYLQKCMNIEHFFVPRRLKFTCATGNSHHQYSQRNQESHWCPQQDSMNYNIKHPLRIFLQDTFFRTSWATPATPKIEYLHRVRWGCRKLDFCKLKIHINVQEVEELWQH